MGNSNVQDKILEAAKKSQVLVTVYSTNGLQLKGNVTEFDDFVVLLEYEEKQQMLYKHSIMMLRPIKHLELNFWGS